MKLNVLDLAPVGEGQTVAEAFRATRELAIKAEEWGYSRYWIAEHHNIEGVASAATPILIAHVAASTKTIRVGSGGIMLPNHAPLIVAEQFGTLETLFPGRIDLGLGRAPGTDPRTARAIRGGAGARGDDFPTLLAELESYFTPQGEERRVRAIPGEGVRVPLWILGSSLFSARLAGMQGKPYAFAGHFAPSLLREALHVYRAHFQPSAQLKSPYVMVGVPIVAAETRREAERLATTVKRIFLSMVRGHRLRAAPPVESMEGIWTPQEEAAVNELLSMLIVGDVSDVRAGIRRLEQETGADELIISSHVYHPEDRLRSYGLIAESHV